MSEDVQGKIAALKERMLSLCALVESQVDKAVRAMTQRDESLVAEVRQTDEEIDQREVGVEQECLDILARSQLGAVELRILVAVLKINNDLERMGDLAVNFAKKAGVLAAEPPLDVRFDLARMCVHTQAMVRDSIASLVNADSLLAQSVRDRDSEINAMKRQGRMIIQEAIRHQPERSDAFLRLLGALRNLERIADCATNIAEDVIYVVEGTIVRHKHP